MEMLVVLGISVVVLLCYVYLYYLGPFSHARTKPYQQPLHYKPINDGGSGHDIPCTQPANNTHIAQLHAFTQQEVDHAIQLAHHAAPKWANTTFRERAAFLQDMLDYVLRHQDHLAEMAAADSGKTLMEALSGEVLTTCEKLRWMISEGHKYLQTEWRAPPLLLWPVKTARVEYVPYGTVAAIVPFNYPLHNVLSAVSSILFAGNAAVVKVSEHASWSSVHLENVIRMLLAKRGHSPDLVKIIRGYAETGEALCKNKHIGKILFIGSPQVGKMVMRTAAENLTPVILELGGKDAFIVLDDADLDHVLDNSLRGIFFNSGQNCLAAERFYVHEKLYDQFLERIHAKVDKIRQGDSIGHRGSVDMGCMTFGSQMKKLQILVDDAKEKGGKVLTGGKIPNEGNFYPPTIVADATHEMKIVKEEAFGPLMTVLKFKSDEEVIGMANDSEYGLGLSVYSSNYTRAEKVVRGIASGMAVINDFGLGYLIQALPFGGVKASGFGKFNGPEGLREFCVARTIVSDRIPGVIARSPPFVQMPSSEESYQIMRCAIGVIYSVGLMEKLSALWDFIRFKSSAIRPKSQ